MMSTITDGNVYRVSVSGYHTITCNATFTKFAVKPLALAMGSVKGDTDNEATVRVRLIS